MADLKPLGSEKLSGDDKLKRILELTYYSDSKNKNSLDNNYIVESKNGNYYGIVKEKDGYYVKKGLNENTLDYIGGIFMKNKNKFKSYSEALKRLELIKGREELNEATKYVLKQNKPTESAPSMEEKKPLPPLPSPEEGNDLPALPSPESDEMPPVSQDDEGGMPEISDDETSPEKKSDYMAEIQKFSGKLGQELRDQKERLESDDIKYVLNMIISAVDLDILSDEDIEEIGKRFERDETIDTEMDTEDMSDEEPAIEDDLSETMDTLENFISNEIDLSSYADIDEEDDIQELDLDEIKNQISKSVNDTLSKYFK